MLASEPVRTTADALLEALTDTTDRSHSDLGTALDIFEAAQSAFNEAVRTELGITRPVPPFAVQADSRLDLVLKALMSASVVTAEVATGPLTMGIRLPSFRKVKTGPPDDGDDGQAST